MKGKAFRGSPTARFALGATVAMLLFAGQSIAAQSAKADVCVAAPYDPIYCKASPQQTYVGADGNVIVKNIIVSGNSGNDPVPMSAEELTGMVYVPPVGPVLNKHVTALNQFASVTRMTLPSVSGRKGAPSCYQENSIPCSVILWQPIDHQVKTYSCGASSARLVVWGMTHADPSEAKMRSDLHMNGHGTSSYAIPKVLNQYPTPRGDKFSRETPGDSGHYFNYVVTDTYNQRHSLIQSVKTEFLPYWSGQRFFHFNVTFGYNIQNGAQVRVAEEYDPSIFDPDGWQKNYPHGNPFGAHWVPVAKMWTAISANQGAIVW
jgi:hypothetical protein